MLRLLRPPSLNHDLGPSGLSYAANRPLNMLMERVALIDSRPWRSIQICAKNVREERERKREREREREGVGTRTREFELNCKTLRLPPVQWRWAAKIIERLMDSLEAQRAAKNSPAHWNFKNLDP